MRSASPDNFAAATEHAIRARKSIAAQKQPRKIWPVLLPTIIALTMWFTGGCWP